MKTTFKKILLAAVTVATLGAATAASALPAFSFDPKGTGSSTAPTSVRADQLVLSSSELITFGNGGATASAVGYIQVLGFLLGGNNPPFVAPFPGYPNGDGYELFFTFNLTDHFIGSTNGVNNFQLDTLTFNLHIDQHVQGTAGAAVFAPPTTAGTGGTVTLGTGDLVIASGTLINGTAAIINGTGVSLNSKQTFAYNAAYFTDPNPFYTFILDAFNNTPGSYSQSGIYGAVNNTGGVGNFSNVPEPSTVALFGIALVGMGVAARRRKS